MRDILCYWRLHKYNGPQKRSNVYVEEHRYIKSRSHKIFCKCFFSSLLYSFLSGQTGEKTCPGIEGDREENKQGEESGKQEDNKGKTIYD
jgi:hypothetical protein